MDKIVKDAEGGEEDNFLPMDRKLVNFYYNDDLFQEA